ncbi:hypothetical protein [Myxococcus hansupus]|uniref:hypothetical protein n=1 Tax=Pseudomyxococcus hansupus TaxID=1297742 RepID=UPI0011873B7F|nr:hypothetical protein [Myxococcus hansupus]
MTPRFREFEDQTAPYLHPEAHNGYYVSLDGCPPDYPTDPIFSTLEFVWTIDGVVTNRGPYCWHGHGFPAQGTYDVQLKVTSTWLGVASVANYQRFVTVRDYLIVSLGDSYGSGEGAPDVNANWDAGWNPVWANYRCHRSLNSPSAQAARALELSDPHSSVTYLSLACSGATINRTTYHWDIWDFGEHGLGAFDGFAGPSDGPPRGSGLLEGYVGANHPPLGSDGVWEPYDYLRAQVDQLADLVGDRPIDALVLSAGGNDIGFGDILRYCIIHMDCHQWIAGNGLRAKVNPLKAALPGRYDALNSRLKDLGLDIRSTYLMEYPDFIRGNSGNICPAILGETNIGSGLGADVSHGELVYLESYVQTPLKDMMQQAAERHGWKLVTGYSNEFAGLGPDGIGHGICATPNTRWINNAYDAAAMQGPEGSESTTKGTAHPNKKGYEVMASYLRNELDATMPALPRVGVLKTNGESFVKEGASSSHWVFESGEIKALALSGNRLGVLKQNGDFYLKEGSVTALWELVTGDVESIALSGRRIGIVKTDGEAYVKEGAWNAAWVWQSSDIKSLVLSGNRIGVLKQNGDFYLKEGSLEATWNLVTGHVESFALSGTRIGIVKITTEAYVKDGAWDAPWAWQSDDTKAIALSGERIGVLKQNGEFLLKEGSLQAAWHLITGDVQSISLSGRRIGIVKTDDASYVKEGAPNAQWGWQNTGISRQVLATP